MNNNFEPQHGNKAASNEMHHDSRENDTIRYEKSDTDNRAIVVMGLIVLAILFSISLSMIPFTKYMWNKADSGNGATVAQTQTMVPEILVEVHPGGELEKFHQEMNAFDANKKIDAAIQDALKQGFSVRKS